LDRLILPTMTRSFATATLTSDDVALAFPLVHAAAPDITLERWQSFAKPLVDVLVPQPAGAIGLRNEAGYFCGLLTYRTDRDLRYGTVLTIDLFTALDVINDAEATNALLQAAEEKARQLNCAATLIRIDPAQKSLAKRIARAGLGSEGKLFCKHVAPRPAPM
jgi:hypothetical protein